MLTIVKIAASLLVALCQTEVGEEQVHHDGHDHAEDDVAAVPHGPDQL
ncbi:hypothetical protein [Microtetraspora glauca]|uniref:Uncharacterized protein n=1 Tax=Microtetraspora glauca TaxID=1996 RepID=A0ABV3GE42_MICGL